MSSLSVSLKPCQAGVLDEAPEVAVLHARLDARWPEAIAAATLVAASKARPGEDILLVAPNPARVSQLIDTWTHKVRKSKGTTGGCRHWVLEGGGTLWLAKGDLEPEDMPCARPKRVFILAAHLLERSPLNGEPWTAVGEMPTRGHWFYDKIKVDEPAVEVYHVDADRVRDSFPDQIDCGIAESDPWYGRLMQLFDVVPDVSGGDLREFVEGRLWLRSDKPTQFLTKRQQAYAKDLPVSQVHREVPFDLNGLQTWYLEEKRKAFAQYGGKKWILVVKSRRGGITVTEQATSYRVATTAPHSDVATLTDTWDKSKRIFEMVHLFARRDVRAPRLVGDSKTALQFDNGSNFFIGTAGTDAFSRGEGLSRFHGSEADYWLHGNLDRIDSLLSGIFAAANYGECTLETTANGKQWAHREVQRIKTGESELKFIFIPWFRDPMNRLVTTAFNPDEVRDTITREEQGLFEEHKLDLAQIAFRREQKRIHRALYPQEFPEDDSSCFIASGTLFFDKLIVLALQQHVKDTPGKHVPGGHEWQWEAPVPGKAYCLGVDSSSGVPGGDPCGVAVMRKDTMDQVAMVHGHFRPRVLAQHTVRLSDLYNGALMGVERNNHGHAVIEHIETLAQSRPELYRPHFRGGRLYYYQKGATRKTNRAGWDTNLPSRQLILDDLAAWFEDHPDCVRSRVFVDETTTFALQDSGKWEHNVGSHDDSIFMWGIARQMCKVRIAIPRIVLLDPERLKRV